MSPCRILVFACCCCVLGSISRVLAVNAADTTDTWDGVRLIAHRGGVVDEQRIENSLPAVEAAVRQNYYMLEVDIRESQDGQLVVHHDPDFRRFYGDDRLVADLTWDEIQELRSQVENLRPLRFSEFAAACGERIELMLDTKGPQHSDAFFQEMEQILRQHGLLEGAYVIGTDQSRRFFRGKAKIGVNAVQLQRAIEQGEDVGRLYFLFEHGDMRRETVELAAKHGVTVVPSVNVFHYPASEHMRRAAADIARLRGLGVTEFQIDSVYEPLFFDQRATPTAEEVARFDAPEAVQAVAVDGSHFYAIANHSIGKYDKRSGALLQRWVATEKRPLQHLNSGVVLSGKLFCAHSNYPASPATSSVEIWSTENLEHVASHSFGVYEGSLTWIDHHEGAWWAVFAHYTRPGKTLDNRWTSLIKFDDQWRRLAAWTFPPTVLQRFQPYSCSGGFWGPDGLLYCSGHDRGEVYRLSLPAAGSQLLHRDTIRLSITGQGIAWDAVDQRLFGIHRAKRQVIVSRLLPSLTASPQGTH